MKELDPLTDIEWWNKKFFVRAAVVFVVLYAVLLMLVERAAPPEGFAFQRQSPLVGIYKCCEAGGRYSKSWVGPVGVSCGPISYFEFLGTNRDDCGLKERLNGRIVGVEQTFIPTIGPSSPVVTKIRYGDETIYYVDDEKLRRLWIDDSRHGAFSISVIAFIWGYLGQMIFALVRRNKSHRRTS